MESDSDPDHRELLRLLRQDAGQSDYTVTTCQQCKRPTIYSAFRGSPKLQGHGLVNVMPPKTCGRLACMVASGEMQRAKA